MKTQCEMPTLCQVPGRVLVTDLGPSSLVLRTKLLGSNRQVTDHSVASMLDPHVARMCEPCPAEQRAQECSGPNNVAAITWVSWAHHWWPEE